MDEDMITYKNYSWRGANNYWINPLRYVFTKMDKSHTQKC